ncbi:MAG: MBL fold metallo-hydrolase [Clostridioides sp.]|jgi:glyoxylase-like metal-dependent hydrolase (beta-lactamase superfamily II)|nr:MBL fold metallo-hydrolase [Clostridioides sp.]
MADLILEHIKGNTYYIPLPTIVGVYIENGEAILIDSSNNKDSARKVLRLLEKNNLKVKMIINTHSNADHIGGNAYFKNNTDCKIATTKLESFFTEYPLLEPAFLYGGYPNELLRNKFLCAKPSKVDYIIKSEGKILDTELEAVELPGHFFEMIGIRTPDNVLFLADSLMPQNIIEKYHLFFLYDIKAHLDTLEKLKTIEADFYVPSHAKCMTDIKELIDININKIYEIAENVRKIYNENELLKETDILAKTDSVLEEICKIYSIKLDANQTVLLGSTIKSYISYILSL